MLITIRRMEEKDAESVAAIEKEVFSEPWPMEEFAKAAKDDKYVYLVATDDDIIVGYAGCFVVCENADITNIAVSDSHRRMGIAEKLLEVLAKQASQKGAESLFLEVRESNEPAKFLYGKQGFVSVGLRKNFYRKPVENAILMEKKIKC